MVEVEVFYVLREAWITASYVSLRIMRLFCGECVYLHSR